MGDQLLLLLHIVVSLLRVLFAVGYSCVALLAAAVAVADFACRLLVLLATWLVGA